MLEPASLAELPHRTKAKVELLKPSRISSETSAERLQTKKNYRATFAGAWHEQNLTNALYVVLMCVDAEGHNCLILRSPAHELNERRDMTGLSLQGPERFNVI